MLGLRIVGGVFAGVLLVATLARYRRRQISRLSLMITWVVAVATLLLAIAPSLYDPLFGVFDFQRGHDRRLIAVELFGIIVLFALTLRTMSYTDQNERSIRLLVEALAVQTFDAERERLQLPVGPCIAVVSPAFNEESNIEGVVRAMPDEIEGLPVVSVVVDDGSEDATVETARAAGAVVVRNPIRRGGGLALRVGYEVALRLDAEVVVSIDADGQHLPEEMSSLVKPIIAGDADMVNGSRVLGEFERDSLIRHLGVHFFSWVVTVMTGQRITDPSGGYRATRSDLLKRLVLQQDQFWTTELLIEGLRHRARIVEVPITIRARAGGKSKKPPALKYGWNFSKAIIQTWLR